MAIRLKLAVRFMRGSVHGCTGSGLNRFSDRRPVRFMNRVFCSPIMAARHEGSQHRTHTESFQKTRRLHTISENEETESDSPSLPIIEILNILVDAPVYAVGTDVKPAEIARQDELKDMKRTLNPIEVLLLVDVMTGQEAAVTTFNLEIGITNAILTKLDGDSRGGAALSVKEVSGKPIKLVGRGERMEDLEPFYPDRMAGRILGMGDVLSFVEKAQEVMKQEVAEDLQKKIMSAKFDFNDFLKQTRVVARMGSMSRVLGMIPGMGKEMNIGNKVYLKNVEEIDYDSHIKVRVVKM
ncbi:unnamed protein product [Lactuca saligna]|uniref:SRP54-type proteins GTP-binding domain-containing protein n=1 Tax=Lactuca saligna TaxID=75948 RepID=A0AA35YUI1_LACSI|nr:unnamed protein product [Lactuca saligna]